MSATVGRRLEISLDDGVLRLHLNRPDKRNALNDDDDGTR